MNKIIFVFLMMLSCLGRANDCDGLLFPTTSKDVAAGHKLRKKIAKKIVGLELEATAYVAEWDTASGQPTGHLLGEGDTLVVGVPTPKLKTWMEEIGIHSIGVGMYGLPEEKSIWAAIRVGDKVYPFENIQDGSAAEDFIASMQSGRTSETNNQTFGFSEATFMVSDAEIAAIEKFFALRAESKIVASTDINEDGEAEETPRKVAYKEGEEICPVYDHSGQTLKEESCSAATTSFVSDMWLNNVDDPDLVKALQILRDRINLNWNYVTRRQIYENFRNPYAHITLFAIEQSKLGLAEDFIENNKWPSIRGLYRYAFMPDGSRRHQVDSYTSRRIPLDEYLDR
jgi:hypothetical protein